MLINKGTAISTSSILLVPYEASHVPTYHEWMKDEKIQAETASEPLTLEEEYAMQRSWRTDADKLTFIACLPLSASTPTPTPTTSSSTNPSTAPRILVPGTSDTPTQMIGDVNLFLTPSLSTPNACIGELELMIAPTTHRRKGHGRSTILTFLSYISTHLPSILAEYGRGQNPPIAEQDAKLEGLRVKIGEGNEGSLGLFRSLGFMGGEDGPNYFGELELLFKGEVGGLLGEEKMRDMRERWGVEGYEELGYGVNGNS